MKILPIDSDWPQQLLPFLSYIVSGKLATALSNLAESWEALGNLRDRIGYRGVYEILDYRGRLELLDGEGREAVVTRREKIRVLQDNVVALVDHAWGPGSQFATYECRPGTPVDFYDDGSMQSVLISLREVKSRDDRFELRVRRTIKDGFADKEGWLETEINRRMKHPRWSIIFPKERHCKKATVGRRHSHRTVALEKQHFAFLSDGRQELVWETSHPRLHDRYVIKWTW